MASSGYRIEFLGDSCGQHGAYTFYRGFRYWKDDACHVLSLGEFFHARIAGDGRTIPMIGELQLLWEEKNHEGLKLSSVRLYVVPENCPCGRLPHHGQDEILAEDDKIVLRLEDLMKIVVLEPVTWSYGLLAVQKYSQKLFGSNGIRQSCQSDCKGYDSGKNEKLAGQTEVVILSYSRYCRYMAAMKRLEGCSNGWLRDLLVSAIAGFFSCAADTRVMFCRNTVEHPILQSLEYRMNHLAPSLKGRRRKKRPASKTTESEDSNESETNSEKSIATSVESTVADGNNTLLKKPTATTVLNKTKGGKKNRDVNSEKVFLKRLHKYMNDKGTPIVRIPTLGFKEVNLYQFFQCTQQLGGYDEVTDKRLWKLIYDQLGGSPGNTSAATGTRKNYEKLLLEYERHVGCRKKRLDPEVILKPLRTARELSKLSIKSCSDGNAVTSSTAAVAAATGDAKNAAASDDNDKMDEIKTPTTTTEEEMMETSRDATTDVWPTSEVRSKEMRLIVSSKTDERKKLLRKKTVANSKIVRNACRANDDMNITTDDKKDESVGARAEISVKPAEISVDRVENSCDHDGISVESAGSCASGKKKPKLAESAATIQTEERHPSEQIPIFPAFDDKNPKDAIVVESKIIIKENKSDFSILPSCHVELEKCEKSNESCQAIVRSSDGEFPSSVTSESTRSSSKVVPAKENESTSNFADFSVQPSLSSAFFLDAKRGLDARMLSSSANDGKTTSTSNVASMVKMRDESKGVNERTSSPICVVGENKTAAGSPVPLGASSVSRRLLSGGHAVVESDVLSQKSRDGRMERGTTSGGGLLKQTAEDFLLTGKPKPSPIHLKPNGSLVDLYQGATRGFPAIRPSPMNAPLLNVRVPSPLASMGSCLSRQGSTTSSSGTVKKEIPSFVDRHSSAAPFSLSQPIVFPSRRDFKERETSTCAGGALENRCQSVATITTLPLASHLCSAAQNKAPGPGGASKRCRVSPSPSAPSHFPAKRQRADGGENYSGANGLVSVPETARAAHQTSVISSPIKRFIDRTSASDAATALLTGATPSSSLSSTTSSFSSSSSLVPMDDQPTDLSMKTLMKQQKQGTGHQASAFADRSPQDEPLDLSRHSRAAEDDTDLKPLSFASHGRTMLGIGNNVPSSSLSTATNKVAFVTPSVRRASTFLPVSTNHPLSRSLQSPAASFTSTLPNSLSPISPERMAPMMACASSLSSFHPALQIFPAPFLSALAAPGSLFCAAAPNSSTSPRLAAIPLFPMIPTFTQSLSNTSLSSSDHHRLPSLNAEAFGFGYAATKQGNRKS